MGRVLPFPRPRRPVRHLADVPPELWRALLERLQPERRARPPVAQDADDRVGREQRLARGPDGQRLRVAVVEHRDADDHGVGVHHVAALVVRRAAGDGDARGHRLAVGVRDGGGQHQVGVGVRDRDFAVGREALGHAQHRGAAGLRDHQGVGEGVGLDGRDEAALACPPALAPAATAALSAAGLPVDPAPLSDTAARALVSGQGADALCGRGALVLHVEVTGQSAEKRKKATKHFARVRARWLRLSPAPGGVPERREGAAAEQNGGGYSAEEALTAAAKAAVGALVVP